MTPASLCDFKFILSHHFMKRFLHLALAFVLGHFVTDLTAQELRIENGSAQVRAVRSEAGYTGFDVHAGGASAAVVRLSSGRVGMTASRCARNPAGDTLIFEGLAARRGAGLTLGEGDRVEVKLRPNDPYPVVSFRLTVAGFDAARWKAVVGMEPFHFLALYLPEAEAWHQRGWLNATPRADRFPLLLDRHVGTPEISAYHYNRNWSYTPPLGAHPLPVIGLWAPPTGRYVGLEFQTTRLDDNSEKDIATGYRWEEPGADAGPASGQFVALVYPYGGPGYQQLVFPQPGSGLASHGTLLWSRALPATADPNRFVWSVLWKRIGNQLPPVPAVPDLNWIPGGIRQSDFAGPASGRLIGGVESPFEVPGSTVLSGWGWHNESPTAAPARAGEENRLRRLQDEADRLLPLARHFQAGGEDCVYWEKPLTGQWTEAWGGAPVTTLHNANGFAAGRLFLGLYRDAGKTEYLPVVDGVFNWARHIAWTRNEFADVPSSPFAIGGTLSASFCLDYYMTFKGSPEADRRARAREALDLAHSLTYRYMVLWPSDNNRADNLDASFLWEPNSGRDWTGAACANEVFWNLDTLAQVAVHTGDPILSWALQGSLSRWYELYQDVRKSRLADYQPSDMTEGYGLYAGNIYGVGMRAAYGFAGALVMTEPVGNAAVRVLAGERAALAFRKGPEAIDVSDYHYTPEGNLSFVVQSSRETFDLALTVPYVDISQKPVAMVRGGQKKALHAGTDFRRPPQALWSLYVKNVHGGDRIVVGAPDENARALPSSPPLALSPSSAAAPEPQADEATGYTLVPLAFDAPANRDWDEPGSWAGLPAGLFWSYGTPFRLGPIEGRSVVTKPASFQKAMRGVDFVYLLYGEGEGPAPSLVYGGGQEGRSEPVEALAWRAWPPVRTARLLLGRVNVSGREIAGIRPGKHPVMAFTTYKRSDDTKASAEFAEAALKEGAADWAREQRQDQVVASLQETVRSIPKGSVAILPPKPGGPAYVFAQRIGLLERADVLSPQQLVDSAEFNARRHPVALYLDGEDYVHTVRQAGDGAAAVERYLNEGGTLVLLPSMPWPMFYATGPGFHRSEALTGRLGLPLMMALEGAPSSPLTVRLAQGQTLVRLPTGEIPFPPGDPRLRSINPGQIAAGTGYHPIADVVDSTGKNYGDAAGLLEFATGGRLLYIAANLQRDPENGFAFLEGAFQFVLQAAGRR